MALDLRFSSSSGLEQGFRAQRVMDGYRTQLGTEAVRAAAWTIAAVKAAAEGNRNAVAGLALGALSSAVLVPLYMRKHRQLAQRPQRGLALRLLFAAVIAANLLQCLLGMLFFQAIYQEGDTAGPPNVFARLRACMLAVANCGVLWLVFYGRMAPLPFRYQWPQLTLAAAIMLWCTDQTCSNSNLQAGHAELHRVLRHLVLPMLLPATTFSLPDSSGLQAGPGPEARALCQTHQPAEVQQRARLLRRVQQQQRQQQPSGSQGEGAVVSSLPVAARQRAQAWLLAAVFVYILWSSWPAHTAPMPPAAAGV
ncbi:hypothetical protein COHA_001071 [Chlorella ohadii]|uniref:Uncharacterized protein n=1 Tax=Chlorella ohadii TaxID=2649997 RepID=A0AAD5DZY4_9CHLO|nr:hypothetical protein COHA_001071 [Chlorella ohadii]